MISIIKWQIADEASRDSIPHDQPVLMLDKNGFVEFGFCHYRFWSVNIDGDTIKRHGEDITHWAPMPVANAEDDITACIDDLQSKLTSVMEDYLRCGKQLGWSRGLLDNTREQINSIPNIRKHYGL